MNENWELLEGREQIDELEISGRRVRPGARVRLAPRSGGDIFDLALAGQIGSVQTIEQDFEGKFYVAVILDDDPGRSIGPRGPGHRFFFAPEEVEWLLPNSELTAVADGAHYPRAREAIDDL